MIEGQMKDIVSLVHELARRQGKRLAPDWSGSIHSAPSIKEEFAVSEVCASLGWQPATRIYGKPRANDFPCLVFTSEQGWMIAERWCDQESLQVYAEVDATTLAWHAVLQTIKISFPDLAISKPFTTAREVFWALILKRKRMLIEAGLATIVLSVLSLITSLYSMQVYDRVVPRGGYATLWVLTVGVFIGLLIDFVLRTTRSMMIDKEAASIDAEVSEYFFARMQDVRLDARPNSIGTIAGQLRGLDQIRAVMTSTTLLVLTDLPFALFFVLVIAAIGGSVAIVPFVIFLLSIFLAFVFAKLIREQASLSQTTSYSKNGLLVETLDAAETLKANLGNWHMLKKWVNLVIENNNHEKDVRRWSVIANSLFALLQQVAYVGMVAYGAYKIADGTMTMGGLIACTIIGGRVNGSLILSLPSMIVQWSYTRSSLKSLDLILTLPCDNPYDRQMLKPSVIRPHLKLSEIKFVHTGARLGLDVPSLELLPGERVGLIGPVGSGKSSLLRVLAGLYSPQQGHVSLDGMDIRQLSEDDLRRDVCYFPQDYRLVQGTLRENLTIGLTYKTDDQLMECADKTGLSQLIKLHPRGLDLPIAEGGQGLSGGQRVLVGLTRLLLAKPRLLLLDEPTSSLDQETEIKVLNPIWQLLDSQTTLVLVTHRTQLLGLVNRLLVMGQGRILHDGQTKEVIEQLRAKAAQVTTSVNDGGRVNAA